MWPEYASSIHFIVFAMCKEITSERFDNPIIEEGSEDGGVMNQAIFQLHREGRIARW